MIWPRFLVCTRTRETRGVLQVSAAITTNRQRGDSEQGALSSQRRFFERLGHKNLSPLPRGPNPQDPGHATSRDEYFLSESSFVTPAPIEPRDPAALIRSGFLHEAADPLSGLGGKWVELLILQPWMSDEIGRHLLKRKIERNCKSWATLNRLPSGEYTPSTAGFSTAEVRSAIAAKTGFYKGPCSKMRIPVQNSSTPKPPTYAQFS